MAPNQVQSTTKSIIKFKMVRQATMAAAVTAVRLHGMIHLHRAARAGPFHGMHPKLIVSVYALSDLGVS